MLVLPRHEGKGDGKFMNTLVDNWGNPIHPVNFTWYRSSKRGNDPESIFKTSSTPG